MNTENFNTLSNLKIEKNLPQNVDKLTAIISLCYKNKNKNANAFVINLKNKNLIIIIFVLDFTSTTYFD